MRHVLLVFVVGVLSVTYLIASPQHGSANMSMMQNCPMKVEGAAVAVADTKDGVVLTITTTTGDVAELRRRTESMAKMHTAHSNMHANMHAEMMPFDVKYEEISNGASLTLTPKDPAKLEEFRAKVRQHVGQMKTGNCSMMQGMMQGTAPKAEPKSNPEDHGAHHPNGENK
jgi:hypothetical protein